MTNFGGERGVAAEEAMLAVLTSLKPTTPQTCIPWPLAAPGCVAIERDNQGETPTHLVERYWALDRIPTDAVVLSGPWSLTAVSTGSCGN
jgi:hypothetical protein